jgi:tight adherence protein B
MMAVLAGGLAFIFREDAATPWVVLPCALLGAAVPLLVFFFRRGWVRRVYRRQLPDMLFLLARSLRAGRSVLQAFQLIGEQGVPPLSREFARMYRQLDIGIPLEQVVRGAAERLEIVDFNIFTSVVSLHATTGGNLPLLLDRLAVSTRDREQFEGQYRATTAMGRVSAGFIAAMVAVILVYYMFFQPTWAERLVDTSTGYAGLIMLGTSLGLIVLGLGLMYWILRYDT